ncbi:MAG: ABC transporter permease subunit [Anderseniella sp.]|nr:ABC transporter permease subunit [Anderseniella sp.]
MANVLTIFRRELSGYFATPIAYVFLIIFALLAGLFTFYVGNLYERGVADLLPFFNYLPWLLLVLVPAISMRLWSEERRAGTIELLMTLPVSTGAAVTGKWLAGVVFVAVALACTLPMWWTVNYLGQPDNGIIAVSYLGALVLAGVYLAIGGCMSALTSNQVIAFVLAVAACFVFVTAGTPIVLDGLRAVLPEAVISAIASLSALTHYDGVTRGVVDLPAVIWAASMTAFWLFATSVMVEMKKGA